MPDDYHLFALPERMKLDLMTDGQRIGYGIQKRINETSRFITQRCRILSDAGRERPASKTLPEPAGDK